MKVSMVIPAYYINEDFVKMTANCLNSMGDERPDEVIVVDDHSPVQHKFEGVTNIRRKTNGRFPKAVNTGLEAATGDVLIVCNNDITFYPGWLKGLQKCLETCDIGSIATSDQGWETRDEITEGDRFGSIWAMHRYVYEELGGLDEQFERAFDDADYYLRAKEAGFKIGKNWGVLVDHKGMATNSKYYKTNELYERDRDLFIKKWGYLI